MRTVDSHALLQLMQGTPDMVLVEVLDHGPYEDWHLPGAINIPLDERFEERVGIFLPDPDRLVVVYCGGPASPTSPEAAERLERLGYSRVMHYPGGKRAWRDADLPIER